ncbi:phage tail protein [Photobacterium leiognathi]|uniref:phage tail protein n=1 Tax=Photobacterium leiognathi TaxID=553611 RepID=UPI00298202E9|nr:phage tail protein [Photobacterium leiognathi]
MISEETEPFISVQPENRTLIEEALEYAWYILLVHQHDPFPELKQPQLTSKQFVSLLAGERGVTDWRPEDSLDQQRKTAHNAFEIHRKAGTRRGLVVAMDALDCDIEITPWYRMKNSPGPYYLDILAWKRNSAVDQQAANRLLHRIDSTKSERDTVNLMLAFGLNTGFFISGGMGAIAIYESALLSSSSYHSLFGGELAITGGERMLIVTDIEGGVKT